MLLARPADRAAAWEGLRDRKGWSCDGSRGARAPVNGDDKPARWGLPLTVLVVGMFMSILDTDIVNVAVPTMQREFGSTTDQVQWVATIYTLMLGIVVPASGWLGDRFGLDRIYNVGLVAFAAGSALCGVAWAGRWWCFRASPRSSGSASMSAASSPCPSGSSPCCWPSPRAPTGAGPPTGSSGCGRSGRSAWRSSW